jgi:hypothetical protein
MLHLVWDHNPGGFRQSAPAKKEFIMVYILVVVILVLVIIKMT